MAVSLSPRRLNCISTSLALRIVFLFNASIYAILRLNMVSRVGRVAEGVAGEIESDSYQRNYYRREYQKIRVIKEERP